jgi:solute carrier family 36 (proton-coupled amino acid transporter)
MVASVISLPFISFFAYYGMLLLIRTKQHVLARENPKTHSYPDLMLHVFGKYGKLLDDIVIAFSQIGFCTAYIVFIGQNLHSLFPSWTAWEFVLCVLPLAFALSLIRTMRLLVPFTAVSNVLLVYSMFTIMIFLAPDVGKGTTKATAWTSFPLFVAGEIYAFEGISIVIPLEESTKRPKRFPLILGVVCGLLTILFVAFGAIGYSAVGNGVDAVITLDIPKNPWTIAVKIALMVSMMGTFPLSMFPAMEILEDGLLSFPPGSSAPPPLLWGAVLRLIATMTIGLVAILVPHFGLLIAFVGALCCSPLMFCFPAALHARVFWRSLSQTRRIIDILMFIFGVVVLVYGTILATIDLIGAY